MRSPHRLHDRESFFKYMSAATAKIVLSRRTLRWSSPILFNDPFDVPREMSFGVEPSEIFVALSRRIASLIEDPPGDTTALSPKLKTIIDIVKAGVSTELKAELLASIQEVAAFHVPSASPLEELRELWRHWLPDFRILCLTESPAHVAMWHHYADKYSGVVLEFKCLDSLDSALLAAKPVAYPATKPLHYTAEGWAELLTMANQSAVRTILESATYTKSPDWSYEAEWRVIGSRRQYETGHFSDYPFHQNELGAVYLGPLVTPGDREELLSLARAFPGIHVWEVEIGLSREFTFKPI